MVDATELRVERLSRLLADHFDRQWVAMTPAERDDWRDRCAEVLSFLGGTAFVAPFDHATPSDS